MAAAAIVVAGRPAADDAVISVPGVLPVTLAVPRTDLARWWVPAEPIVAAGRPTPAALPAGPCAAFGAARSDAPDTGYRRSSAVRLTVRGRRVVAALCAAVALAGIAVVINAVHARVAGPLVRPSAPGVVTVHSGDTLWSIAERLAPERDPRSVVAALQQRNHLPSGTVRVGQRLVVPR